MEKPSYESLEQQVKDLTAALDQALAASQTKSDFIASVSHELRTPMNSIIGMSRLLTETTLDREQQECVYSILYSSEILLNLVNDILDLSKVEAGNFSLENIPFNLRTTIEEMAEFLAIKAYEKNIELITRFDPHIPTWVMGDPGRIRQVLMNLTSNAIKFTERGHVLIDAICKDLGSNKVEITIHVQDTGIGISQEKQNIIFDKYIQLEAGSSHYGGTGLGLTISKQLVELMNGKLTVSSKPLRGSTFTVSLPLTVDHSPHPIHCLEENLAGLRILVVDSHELRLNAMLNELSPMGIEVNGSTSTDEALHYAQAAYQEGIPYHIAIVDNCAGPSGGKTFGHMIKKHDYLNDIALIFISGYGQRGDAKQALEAGFSAYLTKPVRSTQLMEAISAVWHTRKQGAHIELITHHKLAEYKSLSSAERTDHIHFPDLQVLLAEDNEINQMLAKKVFAKLGCKVDIAKNGEEAISMHAVGHYDIIFMDCMMPVMDGYTATKLIRNYEQKEGKHIPIIAMTANVMRGDNEECLEAGMDDYLGKPIRPEKIAEILEKWAPQRKIEDQEEDPS